MSPSAEPHVLQWEAPLSQFQVDSQTYQPRPPLFSPLITISTDNFALQWQLSLEQQQYDAQIFLHFRTPGIPNQGVRYSVFLLQTDGSSTQLTDEIRRALAKYRSSGGGSGKSGHLWNLSQFGQSRGIRHLDRMIWNGDTVRIRVIIAINPFQWNPCRILNEKIHNFPDFDGEPGLVGTMLWSQVRLLAGIGSNNTDQDQSVPSNTDLVFECPNGDRVAAHRAVLAASSDPFQRVALRAPPHQILVMKTSGVSSMSLLEMLQFIYLRHLSPKFYDAPLNELLEAASVFELPDIVKWEIEKVLCIILDDGNRSKMKALADKYDLQIVQHMIEKLNLDADCQRASGDQSRSGPATHEEKASVRDSGE